MYIVAIVIGYLLGMPSPAALLSGIRKTSLKTNGSGSLGATNPSTQQPNVRGNPIVSLRFLCYSILTGTARPLYQR